MREPEEMGWYAVLADDGEPRAVHGVKRLMPEDSVEITEAEARQISATVRANEPKSVAGQLPQPGPTFAVDLQPILEKLEAQAKLIAEHAELHDQHIEQLTANAQKFEQQSKAISEVKSRTATAIAEALRGIEETKG